MKAFSLIQGVVLGASPSFSEAAEKLGNHPTFNVYGFSLFIH